MRTRSELTRNDILKAARYLFLSQGYVKTTTAAIAERAQVTKRTLYGYFPDKRSLFKGVISEAVGDTLIFQDLVGKAGTFQGLRCALITIATSLNGTITDPEYVQLLRQGITEILTQPDLSVLFESGATRIAYNATSVVLRTASARQVISLRDIDAAARRYVGGFLTPLLFDGLLQSVPKLHVQSDAQIQDYADDFLYGAVAIGQPA